MKAAASPGLATTLISAAPAELPNSEANNAPIMIEFLIVSPTPDAAKHDTPIEAF